MRFLKHLSGLCGELWGFARHNKKWWLPPVVGVLLLTALVIVSVSSISPFIYSLF